MYLISFSIKKQSNISPREIVKQSHLAVHPLAVLRDARIAAVAVHEPRLFTVVLHTVHDMQQLVPDLLRLGLNKNLNAASGIPFEQIARAEIDLLPHSLSEYIDAGVLQIPREHRPDRDVLRISLDTRAQTADAADIQMDLHARLRRLHQLFHHIHVVERVDLD